MIRTKYVELSKILEELNKIEDKQERIDETRRIVSGLPVLGLIIQYTYHPDVIFDLPDGEIPQNLWVAASHDRHEVLKSQVKKLHHMWTRSPMSRERKEAKFIATLEMVTAADAKLLIGVKNKRLPQRKLTENFCKEALPELFPADEAAPETKPEA